MGELSVMGRQGDVKVTWDKTNAKDVVAARKVFDELRGKGYLAFKIGADEKQDVQLTAFDPDAEKIILAPPMQGGCR